VHLWYLFDTDISVRRPKPECRADDDDDDDDDNDDISARI